MVSHFESRPAALYLTELDQDGNGYLSALRTRNIDLSAFRGGWVHCAGSVSPWGTHLASEEYEPNAEERDPVTGSITDDGGYYDAIAPYFGGDLTQANPYDYGWQIEVQVNSFDDVAVHKRYAMGRIAHELAYAHPDRKTVYITDDGDNTGFFLFVADQAEDLSRGTLYAAKWSQTDAVDPADGGSANLTWVDLGHADEDDIAPLLAGPGKLAFDDPFEVAEPDDDQPFCPDGFTSVNAGHGNARYHECLRLKDGMALAASRLETRRYAAMLGATTEFRKMEGLTHDPASNTLYMAMSEISRGMEDFMRGGTDNDKYDKGGNNDIQVRYNLCGGIYAIALGTADGMDSANVPTDMRVILTGRMTQEDDPDSDLPAYGPNGPFANNTCDLDGIANPDNITYITGFDTLIIGEDTGSGHQNDMIWSYNLVSGELTRIQTTPYGSETTSPYWYPNINGFAYLMSVAQHPYGESDSDNLVPGSGDDLAYTGYHGPFPAMDQELP